MGLDTTHECWSGSYGAFGRWRHKLAEVAGYGDLSEYIGFGGDKSWPENGDALIVLLNHSDCEGEIAAADCAPLADRLEGLLDSLDIAGAGGGHIGNYGDKTRAFIAGLRDAAALNEPVEFF